MIRGVSGVGTCGVAVRGAAARALEPGHAGLVKELTAM